MHSQVAVKRTAQAENEINQAIDDLSELLGVENVKVFSPALKNKNKQAARVYELENVSKILKEVVNVISPPFVEGDDGENPPLQGEPKLPDPEFIEPEIPEKKTPPGQDKPKKTPPGQAKK
jgi:hypothetical protein